MEVITTDRRTPSAPSSPTPRGHVAARHRPHGTAMEARPPRGVATEALVLREWALRLLGDQAGPPDALWEAVARCEPLSWAVFLRLECCSLVLQTRLDALGAWPRLSTGAASILRRNAMSELRRILSARAQIKTIARLAAEHGWTVIVLKGGAAVAEGELLDLNDVDILVAPDHAASVAAALDALGFKPEGVDADERHHLAERSMSNALMVEVHRAIKVGGGLADFLPAAVPLRSEPPLLAMGPADNVRYLLRHATEQHPERIGRLRDLLLIAHALRACSPEQIESMERELAERADVTAAAMLRMALRLAGRAPEASAQETREPARTEPADPFARIVLRRFVLFHRTGRYTTRGPVGQRILTLAMDLAAHWPREWWGRHRAYRRILKGSVSLHGPLAWIERRALPIGTAARYLARDIVFMAAAALALACNVEAHWIEARTRRGRIEMP